MENLAVSFSDPTTPRLPPLHCEQSGPKGAHNVLSGANLDGFVSAYFDEAQSNNENMMFSCEVTFEGELSSTISLVPRTTVLQRQRQLKFLRLTQARKISEPDVVRADVQPSSRQKLWFPFHFDVPHSTISPDDEMYLGDREEYLPPSLSISSEKAYYSADLFIRGECRIVYRVRARLKAPDGQQTAETVHPVAFTPAHDSSPPLCASDFPREYILKSVRTIRNLLFSQTKILSIQTEEPPPLQFYGTKTASTVIRLRLSHHRPTNKSSKDECTCPPPDKFAVVQSTLQAVTFLSVEPQGGIPRQGGLENSEIVMDKRVVCSSQNRKVRFSSWSPIMSGQDDHEGSKPPSNTADSWQSNVNLVFSCDVREQFVPTFACTYASRRYNLHMLVRVEGYRNVDFELRVPVQLCWRASRPKATSPAGRTSPSDLEYTDTDVVDSMLPLYTDC